MLGAVFGPDLLIAVVFLLIPLGFVGLSVVAVVDVCSHSKVDFYAAGYSRTAWVVVIGALTLFYGFGCLNAAYYLIAVRPKVRQIEAARQRPSPSPSSSNVVGSSPRCCPHCREPVSGAGSFCSGCGAAIFR